MVGVSIEGDTGTVRRQNGRFLDNIPEVEKDMSRKYAEIIADGVRRSIEEKGLDWTGKLKSNVEYERRSGSEYEVSANAYNDGVNYAAWHEYAETPHTVAISPENPDIMAWARSKGVFGNAHYVDVTPTTFFAPGVRNALKRVRREARKGEELREAVRRIYKDI